MATVAHGLQQVKSHLGELVSPQDIFQICRQLGHKWRQRLLDPAVTVQLFLLQLLAGVALEGLRHVAQIPASAQAICKAKARLPLKLWMELVRRSAVGSSGAAALWNGLTACLVDGTSLMTPDTPALAGHFGKAKNQRGTSRGYPMPKLLALLDLTGGWIAQVITLPCDRQEYTCLSRLFAAAAKMGARSLLLGDRGLVSFTHLALLMAAGLQACFRLPRGQVVRGRGHGTRRRLKRLGKQDLLVCWSAARRPRWMSRKRWEKLGLAQRQLTLRQISFRVCRTGFRTHWAWIVTTLLDPQEYPAQDLIELYSKRWQVEVYFRDLKQTLGMKQLAARTITGVRKEILAFVLLYNLVRRLMQQAAAQQNTTPDRISFIDALRALLWSSPGQPLPRLKINPLRLRPSPPRRLKNARHRFPQLKGSRQALTKPPYRVLL